MKKNIFIILIFTIFGCGSETRSNIIHLYSQDKSQVVSIISDYVKNQRFIAIGKHTSKPETQYIVLDISKIPKLGDELGICWNLNGHNWKMANDKSIIIEVKLDTTKYVFRENWFEDKYGIPRPNYYWKSDCFTVGALNYSNHKPLKNGYVKRL